MYFPSKIGVKQALGIGNWPLLQGPGVRQVDLLIRPEELRGAGAVRVDPALGPRFHTVHHLKQPIRPHLQEAGSLLLVAELLREVATHGAPSASMPSPFARLISGVAARPREGAPAPSPS